jgi:hypothetical protein
MSLDLVAVNFNHDRGAQTTALNIRKNALQIVPLPEWRRGVSVDPADSPVAYASTLVRGTTITVRAAFRTSDPQQRTALIHAAAVLPPALQAWVHSLLASVPVSSPLYLPLYNQYLQQLSALLPNRNVLGDSSPVLVRFRPDGTSDMHTFEFRNHQLSGCGINDIEWSWQVQSPLTSFWTTFARSRHRIYTVIDVPNLPWQQQPFQALNTQLPWTDVLDYACRWAAGAKTADDAARALTRAIFQLGDGVIAYDCDPAGGGVGTPHYTLFEPLPGFLCTKFLERLKGMEGNGELVNCTDCGTILSTFANILGCDLWSSRMGFFFDLNPVLSIGSRFFGAPCSGPALFGMHEVAWKNNCSFNDDIFDACIQLDAAGDPGRPPHVPLTPANMPFSAGLSSYRDRLCPPTAGGQLRCLPQPLTRRRRFIY